MEHVPMKHSRAVVGRGWLLVARCVGVRPRGRPSAGGVRRRFGRRLDRPVQWQRPHRLGWRSETVVGQGRCHPRRDHGGEPDAGQHVPGLSRWAVRRLRVESQVPPLEPQLRRPVPQQGVRQVADRRISGGYPREPRSGRLPLSRGRTRLPHQRRRFHGRRRAGQQAGRWPRQRQEGPGRRRFLQGEGLERVPHRLPGQPYLPLPQRVPGRSN